MKFVYTYRHIRNVDLSSSPSLRSVDDFSLLNSEENLENDDILDLICTEKELISSFNRKYVLELRFDTLVPINLDNYGQRCYHFPAILESDEKQMESKADIEV